MELIKSVFGYLKETTKHHKLVKCESYDNKDTSTSIHVYKVVHDKDVKNFWSVVTPPILGQWNKIWNDIYGKTYTLSSLPFAVIFSLELGDKVIGVCGYNTYENSKVAYFHSLAIMEKGYARSFCQHAIDYAKSRKDVEILLIGVSVKAHKWLFDFYERMGAKYMAHRKFAPGFFDKCIEYRLSSEPTRWMFMPSEPCLSP